MGCRGLGGSCIRYGAVHAWGFRTLLINSNKVCQSLKKLHTREASAPWGECLYCIRFERILSLLSYKIGLDDNVNKIHQLATVLLECISIYKLCLATLYTCAWGRVVSPASVFFGMTGCNLSLLCLKHGEKPFVIIVRHHFLLYSSCLCHRRFVNFKIIDSEVPAYCTQQIFLSVGISRYRYFKNQVQ